MNPVVIILIILGIVVFAALLVYILMLTTCGDNCPHFQLWYDIQRWKIITRNWLKR